MSEEISKYQTGEVILIDKPEEWTSFGVVKRVRWLISKFIKVKKIKVGHAGTLDPFATGLLILCSGKKTKEIDKYQAQEKEYIATLKFGATTPSFDPETEIDKEFEFDHINIDNINKTLTKFIGTISQMPPNFSAKKVNGVRAYTLARKGEQADLKPSEITIYSIEILDFSSPFLKIKVKCGKGTYIRALARDIGQDLNSGAYLTQLRRTKIGNFSVEDAMTVEEFENNL